MKIQACLLCLWPIVAVGFSQPKVPTSQPTRRTRSDLSDASNALLDRLSKSNDARRYKDRPTLSTTCPRSTTALSFAANGAMGGAASNSKDAPTRNMFHDYHKPIVLVGQSSNNELLRLAQSLQAQECFANQQPRVLVPSSFARDLADGTTAHLVDDDELLSKLLSDDSDTEYTWPNVLVLDTARMEKDNDKNALDLMRRLYEDANLLSVYVNVEPTQQRSEADQAQKDQLEQDYFVPYSDYELCIRNQGTSDAVDDDDKDFDWEHVEWELVRLLARARLVPPIPGDTTRSTNTAHLTMGDHTFFVSLSVAQVTDLEVDTVAQMCLDVDALEYRTDLLECRDSRFELLYGMQQLRSWSRPNAVRVPGLPLGATVLEDVMPMVYTVRTQHQAGTYPDDKDGIAQMFQMLEWGLRGGVEVLDVESAWDYGRTVDLLDLAQHRYASQILGSHHVVGEEVTTEDAVLFFEQCALNGRAHGAKVVLSIESDDKDRMAYEAGLIATELAREEGHPIIPHISLILGDVGQFSRIINLPFTPVTHESLPTKAAPGQLTAMEIMTTRLLTKIFEAKKYAILGHNIAYSVSPQMHGAAFRATKLPHEYVRADVATVQEFVESDFFQSGDFGGCSVTIPHKQAIIPYMDHLSDAAQRIGSVNTVTAKDEFVDDVDGFQRVLYGDNTDWKGIFNPLNRLLEGTVDSDKDYALILGAGGTARAAAYVADTLGLKRLYYNRTPSKATELADTFGGSVVQSLEATEEDSLGQALKSGQLRVVISTLPAATNFELPSWVLDNDNDVPIVFDVNYKPYQTALLEQAVKAGCTVVRGSEMLWEQGVGQFELWTGRTAPYAVMKQIVLENCLETILE